MTRIATAALIFTCCLTTPLSAKLPWVVYLPTEGKLFAPYWYGDAKLVNWEPFGSGKKYQFKGTCLVTVEISGVGMVTLDNVPLLGAAKFDGAWAFETLDVTIGTVHTQVRCEKDPFVSGRDSCLASGAQVNVSQKLLKGVVKMYPPQHNGDLYIPIMAQHATPTAKKVAEAKSALTVGTTQEELEDWDPFAEGSTEPATISIETPGSYEVLPPDTGYSVSFKKASASAVPPATVEVHFERLEPVPSGGDVVLPAEKTHWWQPRGLTEVTWRVLPLEVGTERTTHNLSEVGIYRVRGRGIRPDGEYLGGWTNWRTFCVGTQGTCENIAHLSKVGDETLKTLTENIKREVRKHHPALGRLPQKGLDTERDPRTGP